MSRRVFAHWVIVVIALCCMMTCNLMTGSSTVSAWQRKPTTAPSSTAAAFATPRLLQKWLSAAMLSVSLTTQAVPTEVWADARLNAPTAAGTRVNSDAESLLRYGLPIQNDKEIRDLQASIESIKMNLKTRRSNFAKADVNNVKSLLTKNEKVFLKQIPSNHKDEANNRLQKLKEDLPSLEAAINAELNAGSGSLQERKSLDEAFAAQSTLAKDLSIFEELFVPDDYQREIPSEFKDLPYLKHRAIVDMVICKSDGSDFDVDGKLYDKVRMQMVVDGYNAPLTGGNFVDLVNRGFYNNLKITRSDGFVVQTGDANPDGSVHGFVPEGSKEERKVPLEIAIKGENDLLYSATTEDDGRGYVATVLPFQSYGALGMARSEFEADSASSQFFWLLFESDLTPAGKNMLDGRYTCFGYTTDGAELLKAVKEGDIIESAKVVSGVENLVLPNK